MAYDLAGKRVLITGASAGIGAALATGFAERGAVVGICARRGDRLATVLATCREHAPESRSWVVDLADLDGVEAFAQRAWEELGGIDVLVNNAGIPKRRRVVDLSTAELDGVMALNYLSPARMIMTVLPHMLERGSGRVVCISSVAARLSPPGEAAYSASKAALTAFCESLAAETWSSGVKVHVLNPGVVDTELFDLPDNDPLLADDIERLPPRAVVEALVDQLDAGVFETWVPGWFGDVYQGKATNPEGYLSGAAAFYEERIAGPD
ncbi:MAG: SDR family NAD(P)-dependent oxidoreductase [Acidimicrobiales bacterium]